MARNLYRVWTSDMVIGAAIAAIGLVAALVRLQVLVLKWNVQPSPLVVHLWPLLLIGAGILLLFEREEHRRMNAQHPLRGGEQQ